MMKFSLNRKMLLVASCLILAVGGFLTFQLKDYRPIETSGGVSSSTLSSNVSVIRAALVRTILNNNEFGKISSEGIKNYDLSFPNDLGYKNSEKWSVFRNTDDTSKFINKFWSAVNNVSDEKPTISLGNKIEGVGTNQPDLLFILPGIKEDSCEGLLRQISGLKAYNAVVTVPELAFPLNFTPYTELVKDIVTIPKEFPSVGCFKYQEKFYYYHVLYDL